LGHKKHSIPYSRSVSGPYQRSEKEKFFGVILTIARALGFLNAF
jgi:hypothetical protein